MAAPLSQCKKIVMVSNGKCELGASKITGEILEIVANLPKSVEALTGIDISKVWNYLLVENKVILIGHYNSLVSKRYNSFSI